MGRAPLLSGMKIITPGLAAALTPHVWTAAQLARREPAPRTERATARRRTARLAVLRQRTP